MFNLRNYIMFGLKDAIGKQSDYWIVLNSVSWMNRGVLIEEDLKELESLIEAKNQISTDKMMEELYVNES